VQYEDTRTIATPEGVELRLHLAGVGSRFAAGLIDLAIKGAIVTVVALAAGVSLGRIPALIVGGASLLFAMVFFDILFEVRAAGRTPGKRTVGLRVSLADGRPVGLRASAVRNVMRLVEGLPTFYVPAIVSILATGSNQRLGDLAAGTVVMHEAQAGAPHAMPAPPAVPAHTEAWDVSAVTPAELAAVRDFLARRDGFTPEARSTLAGRLAGALGGRVAGVPPGMPPERFLEDLAAAKAARR